MKKKPVRTIKKKRGSPPRPHTPESLKDASRGVRLQKALAELGVASRRDCEQMILDGRVSVNGEFVTKLPAWVDPQQDVIEVDARRVAGASRTKRGDVRHTYVMLYKPRHTISTTDDPEGRRHVLDLVDHPARPRLFPVGRLDAESTGLMLLTDDGELANRLTHPSYEVPKQYQVSVKGKVTEADLEKMKKGVFLADQRVVRRNPAGGAATRGSVREQKRAAKRAAVESVRILNHEVDRSRGDRTTLSITLKEGQNREIRRVLARTGFKVRRLKRVAIGPVRLKGLAIGEWRPLEAREVRALRKATGLMT